LNQSIQLILKGFAMGIAEVIPGVSGGTIAFITGIYERLIESIKAFHPSLIGNFRTGGLSAVWEKLNGTFLMKVIGGMVIGFGGGAFGVTYLLETYPPPVWAFFFGLIISSVIYLARQIDHWNWKTIGALVIGTLSAYFITKMMPSTGSDNPLMIFIAGFIAISALILPGISGSFMLLLMGMYSIVMGAIKGVIKTQSFEDIKVFFIFSLGALAGLMVFSRVLSWMFKQYRQITLAVLTGFMIGSLNKIWPWRNVLTTRTNSKGVEVALLEENVMPSAYEPFHLAVNDPLVLVSVISLVIGFGLVLFLSKFDDSKS